MSLADRNDQIAPFYVMDLLARARALEAQGRDIVHLEIGEPDFSAPEPVVQAMILALSSGTTHYTPALGLPELRQAIAAYYHSRYGVSLSAGRVAVTPGASGALQLVCGALINPGDRVLMADPGYPCNRHFVRLFGGSEWAVPVNADTRYQLTAEGVRREIDAASDAEVAAIKAVVVASPSNPTGTLLSAEALADIHALCAEHGWWLIVDEIYNGLIYGAEEHTAARFCDGENRVIVINSFSKYFGMTGLRLGWCVLPEVLVGAVERQAQNLFLAPSTPAQHGALAAFGEETTAILESRRQAFEARRDYLLPAIRQLGFKVPVEPQGAFYLYADSTAFADDSFVLCEQILDRAGVALTPGLDFGEHRNRQHLRFAYTREVPVLEEAVARLGSFFAQSFIGPG